jgi:flagellar assembly protein FliH
MNSSIKPPATNNITGARKFQFDTDFKQEEDRMRIESMRQHEQQIQPEESPHTPAQVFSEDEVNQLRDETLQNGLRQGRMEALQEVEQSIAVLSAAIIDKLGDLLARELLREKMAQDIAVKTTLVTIKKIWPQILDKLGFELVENTIRQSMQYNPEESRIVVRVHDKMLDPIVKRLPQLQDQQAFAGKVIVIADPNVIAGDCRIEWADGGLDRLSRTLSQQMDAALDRILSSLSTSTQNADPERTSS